MARPLFVLGIDVSKDSLAVFDTADQTHSTVINRRSNILKAVSRWSPETHIVGLESTGDYGLLVMRLFVEAGFTVRLLNPILTQAAIKRTVRGSKTDATDSELIAEMTAKGEGHIVKENSWNIGKKTALRVERKLCHMTGDLKRLVGTLKQKQAAGVEVEAAMAAVNSLVENFEDVRDKLWEDLNDSPIESPLARQETIINSHVGCGVKLSAIISEEAGDIKRFDSARQLIAYVGIDPKVVQSGNFDVRGRMTKRGNSNLRHAFYLAANIARMYDPQLKAYFEKKRLEGKHFTVAVCAVSRKMCERIYATVTEDRLYEKRGVDFKEQGGLSPISPLD